MEEGAVEEGSHWGFVVQQGDDFPKGRAGRELEERLVSIGKGVDIAGKERQERALNS